MLFLSSRTALAALLFGAGLLLPRAKAAEPWTDKQLKDPVALARIIKDPKAPKPVIFNVGSVAQIKGAIPIGPPTNPQNLETLREQLLKLPKDKEVLIYCGCCPFQRCPNLRPAFELLKQMKFTNAKVLNLPVHLNSDWVDKGFPMEAER